MRTAMIEIAPDLAIPEQELLLTATRSGGPGGQNVNKVATRITLFFDVAGSGSLTEVQRERITTRLATRINGDGVLRVVAQVHRTQSANRKEALGRFVELLRFALAEQAERRPTRPSRAARQRRVEAKRRHARAKAERRAPVEEE
jgi:ribosome-associated protein